MLMGRNNAEFNEIENIKIVNQVKIVGIIFNKYKSASEVKENWEGRILKIKKIIKAWMKRKLTIIGKIQVIKTFLLSQLVYVFQSISIPRNIIDEINSIFYRFIWKKDNIESKAWERVKRNVLCNKKQNGGLEMIIYIILKNHFSSVGLVD